LVTNKGSSVNKIKSAKRIGSTLLKESFLKKFENTVKYITMFQINNNKNF